MPSRQSSIENVTDNEKQGDFGGFGSVLSIPLRSYHNVAYDILSCVVLIIMISYTSDTLLITTAESFLEIDEMQVELGF